MYSDSDTKMSSFKSSENIQKKEGGPVRSHFHLPDTGQKSNTGM